MIIDGRAIAANLYAAVASEVKTRVQAPKLAVITCAPQPATKQYLELKQRKAKAVGIPLTIIELLPNATTAEVIATVKKATTIASGVVVQLPLPAHIDREAVLRAIPRTHDPDGFLYGSGDNSVLPPVVAAIDIITQHHNISWLGKAVAVVGYGRLVGKPAAAYAKAQGGEVTVVTEATRDTDSILLNADIIISGVGKPNLITPQMVKSEVVIFDAGASEDGGVVVGDVHKDVATSALLFTPVPGGIGPITVAALFDNLLTLTR